jgi:hypothetical protein
MGIGISSGVAQTIQMLMKVMLAFDH